MKLYNSVIDELPALLVARGVRHVFMSPGSRNAALMQVVDDCEQLSTTVVVDERSCAFQALGMCMISEEPVAIVCTSGTAMLNFAPGVCEAYYRQLPLVVITADRPPEWVDRGDSQTMRQPGVMANYTVASVTVDDTIDDDAKRWMNNCLVNNALDKAIGSPSGPVHINIHTSGMYRPAREVRPPRVITVVHPSPMLSPDVASGLMSEILASRRVLMVVGQMTPSADMHRIISRFSRLKNVAVIVEGVSNLHLDNVCAPDILMSRFEFAPVDLLITMGGSIISAGLKAVLRNTQVDAHWHVGTGDLPVDTYRQLTRTIDTDAASFLLSLASAMRRSMEVVPSDFSARFNQAVSYAATVAGREIDGIKWCEMKAVVTMLKGLVPGDWNLQLSNGTTVRYAEMAMPYRVHRVDCNRGVSGIDGSTSTAVGACRAYSGVTLLITGDMSAMYDVGAMLTRHIPARFKMVVIDNGGGAIFRNVSTTCRLPSYAKFYDDPVKLPLRHLATACGFTYFEASSIQQLNKVWRDFAADDVTPAILRLHGFTAGCSAQYLHDILIRNNKETI